MMLEPGASKEFRIQRLHWQTALSALMVASGKAPVVIA